MFDSKVNVIPISFFQENGELGGINTGRHHNKRILATWT